MKLKKDFISHDTDEESLLVPTGGAGFSGLVKGNRTLGAILALLKEDLTEEELITSMERRFDAPEETETEPSGDDAKCKGDGSCEW